MNHYQGKREAPRPEPQRRSGASEQKPQASHAGASAAPDGGHPPKKQKKKGDPRRPLLIVGIILAVVLCLVLVVRAVWNSIVKPPEITDPNSETVDPNDPNLTEEERLGLLEAGVNVDEELPDYITDQKDGVYTFLLIGRTDENNHADMLMLIVFDTNTGEINACSIPRDTMINLSTDVKKINSTIWGGTSNVKNWVRKTLGVYPNFYVMVDWQAVGDLVEAVGGVYFDVPIRMHYIDTSEDGFTIDLWDGYQLLDGEKAMQLIRWRKNNVYQWEINAAKKAGFDGSDTKRTQMQQEFIVEAAKQILQLKNLKYLGSMVEVFKENVETDLSIGNLAWFAQKALELGSANKVTFHTLPANYLECYSRTQHNYQSYVTFKPSELVSMVNTYLNPYNSDISLSNLDLMRINSDGTISSTTGSVADSEHNQIMNDVNSGLAEIVNGRVVYVEDTEGEETENPDSSGETTTDPSNPDGATTDPGNTTDPDSSGTTDPGTATDPGGTTDPGDTSDPDTTTDAGETTQPEDPGTSEGGETGTTDDPSDPSSPNYDPFQDPNYNPDPWADQREAQSAA